MTEKKKRKAKSKVTAKATAASKNGSGGKARGTGKRCKLSNEDPITLKDLAEFKDQLLKKIAAVAPAPAALTLVPAPYPEAVVVPAAVSSPAAAMSKKYPIPHPLVVEELLEVLNSPPCDGPFSYIPGAGKSWQRNCHNDWRKAVWTDYKNRGMVMKPDWDWSRYALESGW